MNFKHQGNNLHLCTPDGQLIASIGWISLPDVQAVAVERCWLRPGYDAQYLHTTMTTFFEHIVSQHLKILPLCPEMVTFLRHHPQGQELWLKKHTTLEDS